MAYQFKNVSDIRSKTMGAIKGNNTSIEIKLRKELFNKGLRYRINYKKLPGSPDIVFVRQRLAIFCDSDFWHGKTLNTKRTTIKNNRDYWINKIETNMKRDRKNNKDLKKMGWKVLRFWESSINKNVDKIIKKIINFL